MIQDHLDHGVSKKQTNPLWPSVQIVNYNLSDHRSPQRNAPLVGENVILNAVLSSQAKPHKKGMSLWFIVTVPYLIVLGIKSK